MAEAGDCRPLQRTAQDDNEPNIQELPRCEIVARVTTITSRRRLRALASRTVSTPTLPFTSSLVPPWSDGARVGYSDGLITTEKGVMNSPRRSGPLSSGTPVVTQQERLKFQNFSLQRTPSGRVSCEVSLTYGEDVITGSAAGTSSPTGDTRLGAEAALRALESFTGRTITFELVGVKAVRAFDSNVVIVSIRQKGHAGPERMLGCYLTEEDQVRGAAIAVLNATNRAITAYIQSR